MKAITWKLILHGARSNPGQWRHQCDVAELEVHFRAEPVEGRDEQKDDHQKMRTATGTARKSKSQKTVASEGRASEAMLGRIKEWLDDAKAEDIVTIDLEGKSAMSDFMVIATGGSDRHVGAIADQLQRKLKEEGYSRVKIEGQPQCDWVLIDTGDIIVHVFRSEVREFYNLEKMWSQARTPEQSTH